MPLPHRLDVRRITTILLRLGIAIVVLAVISALGLRWASRRVPDFYATAVQRATNSQQHATNSAQAETSAEPSTARPPTPKADWEKQLLELHNNLRQETNWQFVIRSEELNQWLLNDLPQKFPKALPAEVREPVVAIDTQAVRIGFRYQDHRLDTVLWLECEPFLTRDPREIALLIKRVRAGSLPLAPTQVIDQLTRAARQQQTPLRWEQSAGSPVAVVRLPDRLAQFDHRQVTLEKITLQTDQLIISGQSKP